MYCIYSGKEIDESRANVEHIIPLSLGGCDELTIYVDQDTNSRIGSEIDGKLTQDFLIALDRVRVGSIGHSNKQPIYNVQSRTESGEPLITTFTKEDLKFFDPKQKEYTNYAGKINMKTTVNLYLRYKFVAKVALAVGYFLYGEDIERYTDCDILRKIIHSENIKKMVEEQPGIFSGIRFYDSLTKIRESDKPMLDTYKMYCSYSKKSNILWTYSSESIIVHVAIFGKFVGLINFKANVKAIPRLKDDWLGHLMVCDGNMLIRKSWRDAILEVVEEYKLLSDEELAEAKSFKG